MVYRPDTAGICTIMSTREGFESHTQGLFKEYFGRAKASAGELRAQVYIAKDISYLSEDEFAMFHELCDKCSRQITKFMQYLANHPQSVREDVIYYEV
jgi:four helix bundle protein